MTTLRDLRQSVDEIDRLQQQAVETCYYLQHPSVTYDETDKDAHIPEFDKGDFEDLKKREGE